LRKLLMGAVVASLSLAVAAGAVAQEPESTFSAKATPSNAGTKRKPKNTSLNFKVTLNKPQTTVEFIDLALPKGLKLSGKGLKRCSVDTLAFEGPQACPKGSKAGPTGTANAVLGSGPTAAPLNFDVTPFVLDSNTLVFYVASEGGTGVFVQSPITGEITSKGRKLRIRIPEELRKPDGVTDASLTALDQTLTGKVRKKYLVSSTGCKNRKHRITGKLTFTQRGDGAPVPAPVDLATTASCRK
jgi:glucose/arabinose dehydrogenase